VAGARAHGRFEDEGWRVRKDGSRFWANAILTAIHDAHGTQIRYVKITRDHTLKREAQEAERRLFREQTARELAERSEHELRESEERYRSLSRRLEIVLEGVADGITVQNRSGALLFANSAAARICGFDSVEDLLRASPAEVVARFEILNENGEPFPPEDFPGRRVLAGERSSSAVLQVRARASGLKWWASVRAGAVLAQDGSVELAVNIWHDVTAQRDEEQQARYLADATAALGSSLEHDEMLSTLARTLVPKLGDWCSIFLAEGDALRSVAVAHSDPSRLETAREYQRKFPPKPEQARGVWHVLRTGQLEVYNDITDEMLAAAAQDGEHLAMLRAAGMKAIVMAPILIRERAVGVLSLVSAESGRRYGPKDVALAQELGRRAGTALDNARLYAQAQQAAAAAEKASRAKDEFLATVSHELRTPLNAIVGWTTILRGRVTDPALAKPIEVIHRNAQAQAQIIDDILDVSRVITGNLRVEARPADLVTIAQDAIEVVRGAAAAKKISIALTTGSEFCLLVADPERLQQVVWNLLSNAIKFTSEGGEVRVDVHPEGSLAVLAVSDTGKGIEPAFLPFVFEPFKQGDSSTTRRAAGLGLGLALVKHIVELHGGRVSVDSKGAGQGATFVVTLPIRAVVPPPPAGTSSPTSAPPAPRLGPAVLTPVRVLVIDDEPDARELLAVVLADAGAIVETASSAAAGFAAFKSFRPDVLVSDIGMPDEDGLSLIRRIRELSVKEGGATPALALTAFTRGEDARRAVRAGYTEHIGKPVNPDVLISLIAKLVPRSPP
jgi:PAS domain S-box-containing protein